MISPPTAGWAQSGIPPLIPELAPYQQQAVREGDGHEGRGKPQRRVEQERTSVGQPERTWDREYGMRTEHAPLDHSRQGRGDDHA